MSISPYAIVLDELARIEKTAISIIRIAAGLALFLCLVLLIVAG